VDKPGILALIILVSRLNNIILCVPYILQISKREYIMDQRALLYFKKSITEYSRGDLEAIIRSRLDSAGPFLQVILNGIDNFGGICYGFNKGSAERSIDFMEKKMGFSQKLATFLYKVVRCGVVHQGMPKIGLKFFLESGPTRRGKVLYLCESEEYIYMNVSAFANLYLETITKIEQDPEKHVAFYPLPESGIKQLFDDAKSEIADSIEAYCDSVQGEIDSDEEEQLKRGEIEAKSSLSAYTQDMIKLSMELPPNE